MQDAVFDIHYNSRRGGTKYAAAKPGPYAPVVAIEAKTTADLYNQVAQDILRCESTWARWPDFNSRVEPTCSRRLSIRP